MAEDYKHVPMELLAGASRPKAAISFDPLLCAYQYVFERLGLARTGVIHLGGHVGQELPRYAALGFRRVVMVEPLEKEFAQLRRRVAEFNAVCGPIADFIDEPVRPRAHAVRCAVTDHSGESTFFRTRMTSLSSLCRPIAKNFAAHWQGSAPTSPPYARPAAWLALAWARATAVRQREITVPCQTLDLLVESLPHGWRAADFSYLRMNIQGAELQALHGGQKTLAHTHVVDLEVNFDERYAGVPSKDDFDQLLSRHGLTCVFGYRIGALGNLLYVRGARPGSASLT